MTSGSVSQLGDKGLLVPQLFRPSLGEPTVGASCPDWLGRRERASCNSPIILISTCMPKQQQLPEQVLEFSEKGKRKGFS